MNVKSGRGPTGRCGVTFVAICRQVQCSVAGVAAVVIVCLVAAVTGVWCIVVRAVVAGHAVICNGHMRPCEREEIIVVEAGRTPGLRIVAGGTVGGELRRGVIRVGGCVVIAFMAAKAIIGRVVVIAVVASHTVVGYIGVGTFQCEVVVVKGKGGRGPAGLRGVAGGTIGIQGQGIVIGVGSSVVITQVAGFTSRGCSGIATAVAIEANQ